MNSPAHPPLLLASNSPRRRELLRMAGFAFDTATADVEEVWPADLGLTEIPVYLAGLKAQALIPHYPQHLIITADTTVLLDWQVLNKPHDADEAVEMLSMLAGNWHTVVSGVQLSWQGRTHAFSEHTRVHFRPLDKQTLVDYVQTAQPLDRAGAYGIQDRIGLIGVDRIEGDYYNVMGLPVCRLVQELQDFLA